MQKSEKNLISFAREAKHPFQFLAKVTGQKQNGCSFEHTYYPRCLSECISDYELLLDGAKRTNLIPSEDGEIKDLYSFLLEELIEFMKEELDKKSLSNTVCQILTRKIVKNLFMPLIYGKTLMSTTMDLKENLSHYITDKGSQSLLSVLESEISWNELPDPVDPSYRLDRIWVYDRLHKKKRGVTLRIATSKRNRTKTVTSTFVNFIHQRDAYIAMNVVESMLLSNWPIYTVHDNFLSTIEKSNFIPATSFVAWARHFQSSTNSSI
ncbi:hypothetical protein IEQ34_024577 [Dendrobium chrysotoxum]|uniref:DNA-directed RNA polymerase n=1 Tax=Dendrobium chrysotoxum TaxID=161865 RepID=A0AAV7FP41_DENCH|nr:hypothetical protein IEQ34_025877 [Dendrobium chrysotoxum]KAH0446593.1 hypothetical protein IEQ34_024577 [Dendrobium chrysotoxum]